MKIGQVYHYIRNQFVPVQKVRSTDTYQYGVDDLLPNTNLKLINDSGTAKRCVTKITMYLQADGFVNTNLAKAKVNKKQTADDLLAETCSQVANFKGFAWSIERQADGQIQSVKSIPFEGVRKLIEEDGFLYNPLKGQPDYKKSQDTKHPSFRGEMDMSQLQELIKAWDGASEIFYCFQKTADNPNYPVPDFNAGTEDIQTSSELSKMDLEAVENGFMPSGILVTGEFDDTTEDDEAGESDLEVFQSTLKKFSGQTKDKNGKSGRFKLLHLQVGQGEQEPKLITYDAKAVIEASDTKRDTINREVCRLFGVPPVLMYYSEATILGNQQAMYNAEKSFNNELRPIKNMITRAFKTVFPNGDWEIGDLQQFPQAEVKEVNTTKNGANNN